MKFIAFGDIHGCPGAATKAVTLAAESQARAIFLGDYVDRGPSAVRTLRVLMEARERYPDWIFLRGNHDQMLLDLIEGRARVEDLGSGPGGQYDYKQAARSYAEWQEADAAEQEAMVAFLNATGHFHETEHFIFCHAILRDTKEDLHAKAPEELIWNYSYAPAWPGKRFVHGHLPVKELDLRPGSINVNTSCGYGGSLTGVLLCGLSGAVLGHHAIPEQG